MHNSGSLKLKSNKAFKNELEKFDAFKFEKYTLENGIQVLLNNDKAESKVIFSLIVNVGSLNDPPKKQGMAHLYEHLSFAANIPGYNMPFFEVSSIIPSNGRAHTSHTTTNYNSTCTENVLSEVIKLEAARFGIVGRHITDQQIKKEIEIISNEASTIANRHLSQFALYALKPELEEHNYFIIGSLSGLLNITLEDIKAFEQTYYQPKNLTIIISGNIDNKKTLELIKDHFLSLKNLQKKITKSELSLSITQNTLKHLKLKSIGQLSIITYIFNKKPFTKKWFLVMACMQLIFIRSKLNHLINYSLNEEVFIFDDSTSNNPEESYSKFLRIIENLCKEEITQKEFNQIIKNILSYFQYYIPLNLRSTFLFEINKHIKHEQVETFLQTIQSLSIKEVTKTLEHDVFCSNYLFFSLYENTNIKLPKNSVELKPPSDWEKFDPSDQRALKVINTPNLNIDLDVNSSVDIHPMWQCTLENGVKINGITISSSSEIMGSIIFKVGRFFGGQSLTGITHYLSNCFHLNKQRLDSIQSKISIYSDIDYMEFIFTTNKKFIKKLLRLLEDIVLNPRFSEKQLRKIKINSYCKIEENISDHCTLNSLVGLILIFGKEYFYSTFQLGKVEDQKNINSYILKEFHKRYFKPNMAKICISGCITKAECEEYFDAVFKSWSGKCLKIPQKPVLTPFESGNTYIVDSKRNSSYYLGIHRRFPHLTIREETILNVAFCYLGDMQNSLLYQKTRVENGLCYSISAYLDDYGSNKIMVMKASVLEANISEAYKTIIETFFNYPNNFNEQALKLSLNSYYQRMRFNEKNLKAQVNYLRKSSLLGLPYNYNKKVKSILDSMTLEETRAVLKKYMVASDFSILIIGDKSKIHESLTDIKFGKILDIDLHSI